MPSFMWERSHVTCGRSFLSPGKFQSWSYSTKLPGVSYVFTSFVFSRCI